MSNGYLGKISAIVTANTGDFKQKLDGAAKDVSSFARAVQSTLTASSAASTKALRDIYTEAQKFDRATKAANSQKLSFKGFDSASLQEATTKAKQLFSATAEVSKPLAAASKAFGKLSSDVQGAFLPALISAQKATEALVGEIGRAGSVGEQRFEAIRNKVDATVASMARLKEAEGLVGSLATGRELAFQQPGMVSEFGRARALQTRALGLAPDSIAGSQIAGLVTQQRSAADEVSRLYSALERVRNSRNGDTAAAEAAYNNQVAALGRVNTQLEEQISLSQQAAAAAKEAANIGAATDVRARLAAISSMERAAQEEAAYRSKAADQAEREAKAMAQVVERQNQSLLIEQNRRSGVLARRNAASFDDATEGLLAKPAAADPIFGSPGRSIQSEIARTRELYSQFLSLSPEVQASLEGERAKLDNIAKSAESGAASIGVLADANERMARTIGSFGNPSGPFGPDETEEMKKSRLSADAALGNPTGRFGPDPTDDMKHARREAMALEDAMDDLRSKAAFTITGNVQSVKQAEAEVSRLISLTQQLDQAQKDSMRGLVGGAIDSLGSGDIAKMRSAITQLQTGLTSLGVKGATGDIGRMGADKFSLGLQQAAFAIDDFFSVTGNVEQRIRAVGNNITQLGFIVGSTTGLFIALGVSLGAQAAAGIYRFINEGRSGEDVAKALNQTLEKQKSLVKELADAFKSFASDIASSAFKGASKDAAELSQRMDEIRRKQRERSDERSALLNPDVQRTRATINARERTLADTSDIGRAAALRMEIAELRAQERAQIRAMRNRPRVSAEGAIDELDASRRRVSEGRVTDIRFAAGGQAGAAPGVLAARREAEANDALVANDRASLAGAGTDAERVAAARRSVESRLAASRATADRERGMFGTSYAGAAAEQEFARLQDLLNRLNAGIESALDRMEIEVSKQALLAASRIGTSLEALEQAVGTEAALTLRVNTEMTSFAGQLRDAQQNLANAVEAGDTDASQAAREEIEAIVDATNLRIAENKSIAQFGEALNRVSTQLINTVLGEAQSSAEQARRQANAAEAEAAAGRSPAAQEEAEFRQRRRRELESDARRAQYREAKMRQQREDGVRRFEADARGGRLDKETQDLIKQRDEAQAEIDAARNDGRTVSADAVRRRDEAQRGLDRGFEDSPAGRANAQAADDFDQDMVWRKQREEDIVRGRELRNTPAERAGKDLADNLRGLEAAFNELPFNEQLEQDADFQKDRRRLVQDAMRQQAPAIFGLADSVENAIMQGPSRSALQVSDVTTAQGASELNRLLRGDDSAKNQDLVELQKQSNSLQELVTIARQNGAPPGVFN